MWKVLKIPQETKLLIAYCVSAPNIIYAISFFTEGFGACCFMARVSSKQVSLFWLLGLLHRHILPTFSMALLFSSCTKKHSTINWELVVHFLTQKQSWTVGTIRKNKQMSSSFNCSTWENVVLQHDIFDGAIPFLNWGLWIKLIFSWSCHKSQKTQNSSQTANFFSSWYVCCSSWYVFSYQ